TAGDDPARANYVAGGGGAGFTRRSPSAGRRGAEARAGAGTRSGRPGAAGAKSSAAESVCRSRGPETGHVGRGVGRERTLCGRLGGQTERDRQMAGAALLGALRG